MINHDEAGPTILAVADRVAGIAQAVDDATRDTVTGGDLADALAAIDVAIRRLHDLAAFGPAEWGVPAVSGWVATDGDERGAAVVLGCGPTSAEAALDAEARGLAARHLWPLNATDWAAVRCPGCRRPVDRSPALGGCDVEGCRETCAVEGCGSEGDKAEGMAEVPRPGAHWCKGARARAEEAEEEARAEAEEAEEEARAEVEAAEAMARAEAEEGEAAEEARVQAEYLEEVHYALGLDVGGVESDPNDDHAVIRWLRNP